MWFKMAKLKSTGIIVLLYIVVVTISIVIFTMLVPVIENRSDSTWNMAKLMLNSDDVGVDAKQMKSKKIVSS